MTNVNALTSLSAPCAAWTTPSSIDESRPPLTLMPTGTSDAEAQPDALGQQRQVLLRRPRRPGRSSYSGPTAPPGRTSSRYDVPPGLPGQGVPPGGRARDAFPECALRVVVEAVRRGMSAQVGGVRRAGDAGGVQRLDLAREQQRAVGVARVVCSGLTPNRSRAREQPPLALVPEQEREHADEPVEAGIAPPLVGGQDDFGVGARAERDSRRSSRRSSR